MAADPPTERVAVRRLPDRAAYDRATIARILDAGLVCHVGIVGADGTPYVLPMAYGRVDDHLYLHGSVASRLMRALCSAVPVCVTVTLLDGIVLARSAFNCSMNYRSVTILGTSRAVTDPQERMAALRAVMDNTVPGHWDHVRGPDESELRQTLVAAVDVAEAAAKVSAGPPHDDASDHALAHWAGVVPLRLVALHPEADPTLHSGTVPPDSVHGFVNRSGT